MQPDPRPAAPGARAVIDTNVWLDLFVFAEPAALALARALADGRVRALRDDATDTELDFVLQRPPIAARLAGRAAPVLLEQWRALADHAAFSRPAPWRCHDSADQKFLDLAFGAGAGLLLTKDRHLLELARPALRAGLAIITPADFARRAP